MASTLEDSTYSLVAVSDSDQGNMSTEGTNTPMTGHRRRMVLVGAGPVGAMAAIYAAERGYDVEVYELRNGKSFALFICWGYS
jgi:kynurenine 3-monooxygenase